MFSARLSERAFFAFSRVYPSKSEEMFKSVITVDTADGDPLKIDAEMDTASKTSTFKCPFDRLFKPCFKTERRAKR